MKKKALGITLTLAMGLSAQFVQVDSLMTGNMSQAVGMQQAEAGIMNGLTGSIDKMKHKAVDSAKKEAKTAVKKALDLDMNGMENHHAQMIKHLRMAAHFTAQASLKYHDIAGIQKDNNYFLEEKIASMMPNESTLTTDMYNFAAMPNIVVPGEGKMIADRLNSASGDVKDDIKKRLSWAREDRAVANWFKVLAARDAVFLVKEATKGIAQASKSGDYQGLLQQLNHYKDVANDGKKYCDFVGRTTGDMDKELKDVEKNHNVSPASKARVQQVAKSMMPE